ncbi:hypothetical protein E2986_12072 [Frieseomelitta varia]|uniref:EF-hand domain-containing protein n=1 Tax=Frieseomelitta varia TaxID=561572 RepID=A0A833RWS1_9HYME|nr:hypothetical protein E2986_12072 [Frieseomelitta varia]
MLLASGASIPTIAGTVEEEEEYARSEANSAHYDGYVTDHTDLASEIDIDESEYRRELLNDKWRMLFDKFDPEGFGEIPVEDFLAALKSPEWKAEIPPNKRDILLTRAKESRVQAVTFQDFVNVVSGCMRISIKLSRKVCLYYTARVPHPFVPPVDEVNAQHRVEEFRARRCLRPTTPLCTARTGRVIHNIRFESGPNNVNAA